ncbi:MAG: YdcF family protein [Lachnospiraceae bacterium]|nr:YdcF family protein [Lachnospiraceae bacterium]
MKKERRDKKERRRKMTETAVLILGILFILYFLGIELYAGHGTNFYFIWLIAGAVLLLWTFASKKGIVDSLPVWLRRGTGICAVLGLLCFLFVEGLVISGFFARGGENLDYIIVLGAQLKTTGPSRVLQLRLDEACDYLTENPETKVIVSGGQGSNEPDTEAQGMYEYLVEKGIDPQRIIREDRSRNTTQNIAFSSDYLDKEKDRVGIVTNNFHIYRAVHIAMEAGYRDVCGIAAPAYPFLQPNNMLREFFGIVKDYLFGNM